LIWPLETSKDAAKSIHIVIQPSFGKGLVQTVIRIPSGVASAISSFFNYPVWCFVKTCEGQALINTIKWDTPLSLGSSSLSVAGTGKVGVALSFDSIKLWHILLVIGLILLFTVTPVKRLFVS
jgi:hypothetical protein